MPGSTGGGLFELTESQHNARIQQSSMAPPMQKGVKRELAPPGTYSSSQSTRPLAEANAQLCSLDARNKTKALVGKSCRVSSQVRLCRSYTSSSLNGEGNIIDIRSELTLSFCNPSIPASPTLNDMSISVHKTLSYPAIDHPARWICLHLYYTFRWLFNGILRYSQYLSGIQKLGVTFVLGRKGHRGNPDRWTRRTEMDVCSRRRTLVTMPEGDGLFGTLKNFRLCLDVQNEESIDGRSVRLLLGAQLARQLCRQPSETCDPAFLDFNCRFNYVTPTCTQN
jgi:hypothetical protein